jgi:hypothetical protein
MSSKVNEVQRARRPSLRNTLWLFTVLLAERQVNRTQVKNHGPVLAFYSSAELLGSAEAETSKPQNLHSVSHYGQHYGGTEA